MNEDTDLFRHVSGAVNSSEGRGRGELAENHRSTHSRPSTPIFELGEYFGG
jgi:hypothetical protein